MSQSIPMVNLRAQYHRYKDEIDQALLSAVELGAYIQGPQVKEFENALAEFLNVKHVISCANGTDALQLAIMSLDLPEGSEILTPAFSYAALVEVILLLKLKPVFVDVDPNTYLIDVNQLESLITANTKAIATVHLFGQISNMDVINEIAQRHELTIVEDNAQAIGAKYTGKQVSGFAGTLGHIGTTSFFPSKNLGCFGDGGAVFTNNDLFASKLRMLANHGQSKKYTHSVVGINSRLDSIQAAILNVKLKYLSEFSEKRIAAAERYNQAFCDSEIFNIPQKENNSTHVYNQYTICFDSKSNRDRFNLILNNNGISSMIYYPISLHKQNAYFQSVSMPISDQLCDRVLSLPICPELTIENQNKIIQLILNNA